MYSVRLALVGLLFLVSVTSCAPVLRCVPGSQFMPCAAPSK